MSNFAKILVALAVSGCLAACQGAGGGLTGDAISAPGVTVAGAEIGGLQLGTTDFVPPGVTRGPATGTSVGDRVGQLQDQLQVLQGALATTNGDLQEIRHTSIAATGRYYTIISRMNARLRVGTTPGNPVLVEQLSEAQATLQSFDAEIARMSQLANSAAANPSKAGFLLESVRATYGLSGAVEADHRYLTILEDEVEQTNVLVNRLQTELAEDYSLLTNFHTSERLAMQGLQASVAAGQVAGSALVGTTAQPLQLSTLVPNRTMLVRIVFDQQRVDYAQPLLAEVNRALGAQPGARFEIVAVSAAGPAAAEQARVRAEEVRQTLIRQGVSGGRLSLSAQSSSAARSPEVHVYQL